jgi:hypothetical protein
MIAMIYAFLQYLVGSHSLPAAGRRDMDVVAISIVLIYSLEI